MRIAFILNKFPALSETFILNQITGLIDRGHEVDILADGPRNEPKIHPDVERYDLLSHTYYYNLERVMPGNKVRRVYKALHYALTYGPRKPEVFLRAFDVFRFGRQALTLRMLFTLMPFIDKGPYDIIQCHYAHKGLLGVFLRDMGVLSGKVVTMVHGYDVTSYARKHADHGYAELFKKGDLFIHASNHMKSVLTRLGCDERKMVLHHVGVDTRLLNFSPRFVDRGVEVRILSIGRLVEKKGFEYAICGVAKALEKYPNIRYQIAGDGKLRLQLQALIEQLNVSDRMKLLGWQTQDEIQQLFAEAQIFLLTSVTASDGDEEGQGLVLQEAQAVGLPVICTRHNGFPEGILEGQSGFLVPERDPVAIAETIEYMIGQAQAWPEMGRAGRRFVEENYNINRLNDKLEMLYRGLINS